MDLDLSDPNRSDFESLIASDCNRDSKNHCDYVNTLPGEMKVSTSTVAALFSKMALTGQRIAMVDMVFPCFLQDFHIYCRGGWTCLTKGSEIAFWEGSVSESAQSSDRLAPRTSLVRRADLRQTLWGGSSQSLVSIWSPGPGPRRCGQLLPLRNHLATLRFHCDFCGKSLRLRSCDRQSLAICDSIAWVTKI